MTNRTCAYLFCSAAGRQHQRFQQDREMESERQRLSRLGLRVSRAAPPER